MRDEKIKVRCIKSSYPSFNVGNVYSAKQINVVLTSAPQLVVTDDLGNDGHIIAEGQLSSDEWFVEHFEVVKD